MSLTDIQANIQAALDGATDEQKAKFGCRPELLTSIRFVTTSSGNLQINMDKMGEHRPTDDDKIDWIKTVRSIITDAGIPVKGSMASRRTYMIKNDKTGELEQTSLYVSWPCVWYNSNEAQASVANKKVQALEAELKAVREESASAMTELKAMMAQMLQSQNTQSAGTPTP